MNQKQEYFVAADEITFKFELSRIDEEADVIRRHFLNYDDEVCYVFDNDKIYGIITVGDLARFLHGAKSFVNIRFSFVEQIDFEAAGKIFSRHPSVHEVPVIQQGKLLGCIKSGKCLSREQWEISRSDLEYMYNEIGYRWQASEIIKYLSKLRGKIFLYDMPRYEEIEGELTELQRERYEKKKGKGLADIQLEEKKAFWGDRYSEEYIKKYCHDVNMREMYVKNGVPKIKDISNSFFHLKNGYRITDNVPQGAKRKIFLMGPCIIGGVYVEDKQTIAFYLQQKLLDNGYGDYEVITNWATGEPKIWAQVITEEIGANDIVIVVFDNPWYHLEGEKTDFCIRRIESAYLKCENPIDNILDMLAHCNGKVNKEIAELFYQDILSVLEKEIVEEDVKREAVQDYYISREAVAYFKDFVAEHQLKNNDRAKTGAIVMNCNPFTKGHLYLVEKAAGMVDLLYVFVVQEDKSVFPFAERIEMVRKGTEHIENVKVLPSGRYIISKETFSQYFEKDVVEIVESMDYDVRIFGEVVAKELGISVRFVGEEPFDKVTAEYNATMKRILPEYDVEVVEIPRLTSKDGMVISASAVRRMLEEGNEELLGSMLPKSTLMIMKSKLYWK